MYLSKLSAGAAKVARIEFWSEALILLSSHLVWFVRLGPKIPHVFHQHLLCWVSEGRNRYGYKTHINAKNSQTTHKSSQMSAYGEIRPLIVFCHPATFQEFTPGNQDLGTDGDFVWQPWHRRECFSGQGRLPLTGNPPWTVFGSVGGDWGDLKLNTMWHRREPRKNGNWHRASKQADTHEKLGALCCACSEWW